jgi:putative ABC transport system permease protein
MLDTIRQDLRFAVRAWSRTPGFALTAVVTLALGIGANTAVFSVISGVLLRPLPFDHPDRLAQLTETVPATNAGVGTVGPVYVRDFLEFRSSSRLVEGLATYTMSSRNVVGEREPRRVSVVAAETQLFPLLGVAPAIGRTYSASDPPNAAVASNTFWRSYFSGDRGAIGRTFSLDGAPYVLIGVMPEHFRFPYEAAETDLWLPAPTPAAPAGAAQPRLDKVVARLRPGASIEAARQELAAMRAPIEGRRIVTLRSLHEVVTGGVRQSLIVLFGAVGMVLLVACVNVANLLLARTASRDREIATRVALGAGRGRLVRQFLTESLLLALAGAAGGLVLGIVGMQALIKAGAQQLPRVQDIGFDWRVFAFLLGACVLSGIAFGSFPALAATVRGSASLKTRGVAVSVRDGLVVVEVALAFVLLAGAGLLLRTFLNLQRTDPGFRDENVLTAHVVLPGGPQALAIEERVSRIPGVRGAGIVSMLPLQHSGWTAGFRIPGRAEPFLTELRYVTPGYFRAMGIPLRRGREFTDRDVTPLPLVIVVNETLARQYFPDRDPIGVKTDRGPIVGVVGDVRPLKLSDAPVPIIYYAMAQNFAQIRGNGSTLVVSGNVPVGTLTAGIRNAVREVLPDQAIFRISTMSDVVSESLATPRLYTWLIGLFAGTGVLLAVAGIYGVVSYLVTLRSREFGIRVALGAGAGNVVWLVVRRGMAVVALGLVIGWAGGAALTRVLKSFLYGVAANDPRTFTIGAALLAIVALCACLAPAARAARVDPAVTLRAE